MLLTLALALLPACDFTIRTAADWARVNDPDKTVICVAPAPTYTYEQVGIVQLSASGTAGQPRWLRWQNDDESVHPARVPAEQTAAIAQFDLTGSHWIIDRLVVRDAIYIHEAERITVQGNEFINLVDGVSNGPGAGGGNRFVGNEFYQTPEIYTNCRGKFDPNGGCACSEGMAIVAKGPADQPESYIEDNLVWGFRKTDPVCAGSGTPGVVLDFGSQAGSPLRPMLTRHFTVRNNVIIAWVPHAIHLGRLVEDLTITGNYVANADSAISNVYGQRITVKDNIFLGNGTDYHTGPVARDTVYSGNRRAGTTDRCMTLRHITEPRTLCVAY